MSADMGEGSTWGKRFDPTTDSNPIFVGDGVSKIVDFAVLVPPENVKYEEAQKGALKFKVTLGKAFGIDCIKWSGPYLGQGGLVAGLQVGPTDSDNFLVKVEG